MLKYLSLPYDAFRPFDIMVKTRTLIVLRRPLGLFFLYYFTVNLRLDTDLGLKIITFCHVRTGAQLKTAVARYDNSCNL